MLVEFKVGNFLSFKEPVCLSFSAAKPIKEFQEDNVFSAGRFSLLKSAAVYGANASGKSNLLSALAFMRHFVLNSSKETQAAEPIAVVPFQLDTSSAKKPSHVEVRFVLQGLTYRYGFEVDGSHVAAEWLFRAAKNAESRLFVRLGDDIRVAAAFPEGASLESKTRSNALFLSVVAQFNGSIATSILDWFRAIRPIHGLFDFGYPRRSFEMLQDSQKRHTLLALLREADLGIEDLIVKERELNTSAIAPFLSEEGLRQIQRAFVEGDSKAVTSVHAKYQDGNRIGTATLDYNMAESAGTKKFLSLAGPIMDILEQGGLAVVDELDSKLHPLLSIALVRLFNSATKNPKNAQLLFATHDTNLLRHGGLRRDQIWFVEKAQQESSDLYSLAEFKQPDGKKVRNDASFQTNYLAGRYGAIPFLGDLGATLVGNE